MKVKIKDLTEHYHNLQLPAYATSGSAGVDLQAYIPEYEVLYPGEQSKFRTGIAIHIEDPGYAGLIIPRSGLGSKGLVLANTIGLIDSDYQGELIVNLWNRSEDLIRVNPGDRIAQLVIIPVQQVSWIPVTTFETSTRGEGGFGSTGV